MSLPVFHAQVKTFAIARQLTGDNRNVTPTSDSFNPPYCLRILKAYRTSDMQAFRDLVACEARKQRSN